jgi:hypothetical protein
MYNQVIFGVLDKPGPSLGWFVAKAHGLFIIIGECFSHGSEPWYGGRAYPSTDLGSVWGRDIGHGLRFRDRTCPLTDAAKLVRKHMPDALRGGIDYRLALQLEMHGNPFW